MDVIINHLIQLSGAMGLFALAWALNFLAGMYKNIRIKKEDFEWSRLWDGVFNAAIIVVVSAGLVIWIDVASSLFEIDKIVDSKTLNFVAILLLYGSSAGKYALMALQKLRDIIEIRKAQ